MGQHIRTRALHGASPRGIIGHASAEAAPSLVEIRALIDGIQTTFASFKEENDKALKKSDVVQAEKVDRVNAELTRLQDMMTHTNASIAALQVGAGGGDGRSRGSTPEQRAHAQAFGKFFRKGAEAGLRDLEIKAGLRTDSDPDGGWFVPEEAETTIDRVLGTVSAIRSISTVRSIGTKTYTKLVNLGGAGSGWVGEREARPGTATPTLSELEFPVMEIYANPAATQTLLDDSRINIEQWLAEEVSIVFAEAEGTAFVSGDGVKRPRGFLSYDKVANASYAWGKIGYIATGVAAALTDATHNGVDALLDLVYGVKQGYRQNATFVMNRALQAAVRKLKSKTEELYLWQPSLQVGQPATLMGYPIVDDDNMPDVGADAYPIAFGDFRRGYLVLDRVGIRVLRDPYTDKPNVYFYTTKRVGGGVQDFAAIKLLKVAAS